MEDGGHGKDAFLSSPLFSEERKKFKTYNAYYKFLASNEAEHNKTFSPKYLKYLESKAGKNLSHQLAFNYGGYEGLKQFKAGNLNYIPPKNTNTIGEHINNSLSELGKEVGANPEETTIKGKSGKPLKIVK
jgi:hypothetical protein